MLITMLTKSGESHPDNIAIIQGEKRITYTSLIKTTLRLQKLLSRLGIEPADSVAVVLPNEDNFVFAFFAIAALDAIMLPLNPELNTEELEYYIKETKATFIITNTRCIERHSACLNYQERHPTFINLDTLLSVPGDDPDSSIPKPYKNRPDHDFLYHYSSGSTGLPKRVVRTQGNCVEEADNFIATCGITPDDRFFCSIPLFHAHGMCNAMLASIRAGATLVIMENPQPFLLNRNRALKMLAQEKITVFPGVPFQFEALTRGDACAELRHIRLCFTAGSKLPLAVYQAFLKKFAIPVRQLYGSTETGSLCINLDEQIESSSDSVGRPMRNVTVEIWDEAGKPLAAGSEGDIAVSSPAMTRGYYNQDELNKSVFRNGYFLPGDVGRLDEEGRLFITGRKRQFIEVAGHKVDPAVVERCLLSYIHVREAVVVGVPVSGGVSHEQLQAIIVTDGDCGVSEVLGYCRTKLASFEVPQIIDIRDKIERDSVGKVRIKRLTE